MLNDLWFNLRYLEYLLNYLIKTRQGWKELRDQTLP